MRRILALTTTAIVTSLAAATPASAAANPYTPGQVCGPGFGVIDSHAVRGPKGGHLGTAYLLWDGASGRNCAVLLKRRAVGRPTYTAVSVKKRGARAPWVVDFGDFSYYAGPVYVKAAGRCVRFGASMRDAAGNAGSFTSPFGHCG